MSRDDHLSTDKLLEMLFKSGNLNIIVEENESNFVLPSFSEYITALSKARDEVPERIIARANIEKAYGHKIFSGARNPSRDTVIQLAFGFEADVDQTQELLKIARKSVLYPRIKRDAAIIYCLHKHFSIVEVQIVLDDLGLPILGEGNRNE